GSGLERSARIAGTSAQRQRVHDAAEDARQRCWFDLRFQFIVLEGLAQACLQQIVELVQTGGQLGANLRVEYRFCGRGADEETTASPALAGQINLDRAGKDSVQRLAQRPRL